jgi:tetratricopeptide (TPR) repeat protein
MYFNLTRKLAAISALIFLAARLAVADTNSLVMPAPVLATPTPAPAPADTGVTREEVADNYLQIQEQIHAAQLAIEQNQKAEVDAVQSNATELASRLELLEQSVAKQRSIDAEEAHKTQQATLFLAGALGLVGLGIMLLMVYFQWRAFAQLAQISSQQHAAVAVSNGVHHLAAPGRAAVEAANAQLLDAVGRLEQRINELEGGQRFLPDITTNKPSERREKTADLLTEGQDYLDANAPLKALECFDRFLAQYPDRADGMVKRAAALEKLGRDDEAVDCYNQAIEADNTLVIAHLHKGGLLNRLRRYDEALNCYEQALMAQEKKAVAR